MDKILFTIEEAAQMLSISPSMVRRLMAGGYLPVRKIGRLLRFHRKDIEAVAKIDIPNLWPDRDWPREREKKGAA